MTLLQVRLFGGFQLQYGAEPLETHFQTRQQSLLAYLILHRHRPQARQHVAFLFWPDVRETQARAYLRRELSLLRKRLPDAQSFLTLDNQSIQWRVDAPFQLDVAEVEALLLRAKINLDAGQLVVGQAHITQLLQVCQQGELLPGFYDEWIAPLRTQLQQQICAGLEKFILALEAARQYGEAIQLAQQLLLRNPLHEPSYRHLMRLHALNHNKANALQLFQDCCQMLAAEFDATPSAETKALYEQLLHGQRNITQAPPKPLPKNTIQLVGRHTEWQRLLHCWQTLAPGQAHLLILSGEAGIGKTRLAEELGNWADAQNILTATAHAYAAEGSLPYGAVIDLLRTDQLAAHLAQLSTPWQTQLARLLPDLQPSKPLAPSPDISLEQWQRRQLFEALVRALLISQQPLLIRLDDLHWVDPETLEWLHFLLRFVNQQRTSHDYQGKILIVATVRAEEVTAAHPLTTLLLALRHTDDLTELTLPPLSAEESMALGQQFADEQLTQETGRNLFQYTEGNPLFIVEHMRSGLVGYPLQGDPQLPPKVKAVIEMRLAQLSPQARQLAGLAAVIGREFRYRLLVIATDEQEAWVIRALDELCQRRIVQANASDQYDFTHDRLREVAYQQLNPALSRLFHRRVAAGLEALHHADLTPVSGQLAFHFARGGEHRRALAHYIMAGNAARAVYAIHQVIHYLERGLAELQQVTATTPAEATQFAAKELEMQVALGAAHLNVEGYASRASEQAYRRALLLGEELNAQKQLFDSYWGLHEIYLFRAKHDQALAMSNACMRVAQALADPALQLQAHHALFGTYMMGDTCDLARTLHHATAAIDIYDPIAHHDHTFQYGGHDPRVCARQLGAKALWLLGYPDQALRFCEIGLAHVDAAFSEDHYPLNVVFARRNFAEVYMVCGELARMAELMEQRYAIAKKFDFVMYVAQGNVFQGWVLTHQQQVARGIPQIELGVQQWADLGIVMEQPNFQRMLAECYTIAGRCPEALAALDVAEDALHRGGGRFYEPEIYRLRGKLLAAQGADEDQVEACYQQAITTAQQLQAQSLELRATLDLSQLWFAQGKQPQAYATLNRCYNWFTEGFQTPDLRKAQALLRRLAQ